MMSQNVRNPPEGWVIVRDSDFGFRTAINKQRNLLKGKMMAGFLYKYGSIVGICFAIALIGWIDKAKTDALKVEHLLQTIEAQQHRSERAERSAEVTEEELNAYIVYRLGQEKKSYLSHLKVKLLPDNHVQGEIKFDLEGLNLDVLIGRDLDFEFKGAVHTRDGAGRLELNALYLDGQAVAPQVMDFVIDSIARFYGTEMGGINDWYALPKGIKRITVGKEKALLFY